MPSTRYTSFQDQSSEQEGTRSCTLKSPKLTAYVSELFVYREKHTAHDISHFKGLHEQECKYRKYYCKTFLVHGDNICFFRDFFLGKHMLLEY
jgi:hypothetical protein